MRWYAAAPMSLKHLSAGASTPEKVNVIVEIPTGSQNKYEWDAELNVVKLDRVLYSPMMYPCDYGFVPSTLGPDGDPLDAMVLVTNPTLPGVLIEARPVGVLDMVDAGEQDDKILCVPVSDPRFAHVQDIADVPQAQLDAIAHFFSVYKQLEGKTVTVKGWQGAEQAKRIVQESVEKGA